MAVEAPIDVAAADLEAAAVLSQPSRAAAFWAAFRENKGAVERTLTVIREELSKLGTV